MLDYEWYKNHINLHHSQTREQMEQTVKSIRTILIYIILKHLDKKNCRMKSIRTILIYIILKHSFDLCTGELKYKNHINLHHSQTVWIKAYIRRLYKNHINLHHSQTYLVVSFNL